MKRMFDRTRTSRAILRWLILFLIVSCAPQPSGMAQPIGRRVGPQFPFLASGARAASLGDATIAIIDNYSGLGTNPATLGMMKKSLLDYTTQRVQKGVTFEHLGAVYKVTTADALALTFDLLHFGGTDFYDNRAVRKLGYEMRSSLAYSRLLSDEFAIGVNVQALNATTGPNTVWAVLGDFGVVYTPGQYIRYGLSIKNIGTQYKVAAQILPTEDYTSRVSKVVGVGLALDFPFADASQRFLISSQLEKVLAEENSIYKIGIEYAPFWTPRETAFHAALRVGLLVRSEESQPRLGMGLGFKRFAADYAYSYAPRYHQPSHMFTITYSFGRSDERLPQPEF